MGKCWCQQAYKLVTPGAQSICPECRHPTTPVFLTTEVSSSHMIWSEQLDSFPPFRFQWSADSRQSSRLSKEQQPHVFDMALLSTLPFSSPFVSGYTSVPNCDISVPSNDVPQDDITDTVIQAELDLQDLAFQKKYSISIQSSMKFTYLSYNLL